ncbi:MAG: hypothetical protein VB934_11765 [Polyangiaceae bacterium]
MSLAYTPYIEGAFSPACRALACGKRRHVEFSPVHQEQRHTQAGVQREAMVAG